VTASARRAIVTTTIRPTLAPELSSAGGVGGPSTITIVDAATETLDADVELPVAEGSVDDAVAVWVFVFVTVEVEVSVDVLVCVEELVWVAVEVADDVREGTLGVGVPAVGRTIDGLGRADTAEETAELRPPPHDEAVTASSGRTARPMRATRRRRMDDIGWTSWEQDTAPKDPAVRSMARSARHGSVAHR
jgi:hypothetical protein